MDIALRTVKTLLHGMFDAAVVVRPDCSVLAFNTPFERLSGLSGRTLRKRVGRGVISLDLLGASAGTDRDAISRSIERKRVYRLAEIEVTNAKNQRHIVWFSATPIVGSDGRVTAVLAQYRDVSSEARMQERFKKLLALARRSIGHLEKMATVGRFAAGVAHEINNPIAFVLENVRRLHEQARELLPLVHSAISRSDVAPALDYEETLSEWPQLVEESLAGVLRVRNIVRQLHSFSNVRDTEAQEVQLGPVIDAAITLVHNQIDYRARLERRYADVPPIVCAPSLIVQVVVNLLVNAVHAIDEGSRDENLIVVRTVVDGPMIAIEVHDTGCGIPPEHLSQIMEPFFTTKSASQGTGLGLSISASIIEQHGGRFEIRSEVGRGSTMRMLLPIDSPLKPATSAQSRIAPPSRRAKLLLIDDEANLLRALRRNLKADHDVEIAHGGSEGLKRLADSTAYDLVLVDLMMPEMNGMEFYRQVMHSYPDLGDRVVFMSGGIFAEELELQVSDVGLPVLRKPFDRDELHRLLATTFGS